MIQPMNDRKDRIRFDGVPDSDDLCREMRREHAKVILAFSAGKDSIAAWIQLRRHGFTILPYHMYMLPDLEFVEDTIRYYEEFFGTRILRVPHPSLYRMLNEMVFCPPERCKVIEQLDLPEFDYDELRDIVCDDMKVPRSTWTASGVRCADSMQRRASFRRHGAVTKSRLVFYPVWDWKKAELVETLREEGVKMPMDYEIFGRSFDGIDFRFLWQIKNNFPRDYARILEWFPLAELEIKRYEYAKKAGTAICR